jgi:hypothetical protein
MTLLFQIQRSGMVPHASYRIFRFNGRQQTNGLMLPVPVWSYPEASPYDTAGAAFLEALGVDWAEVSPPLEIKHCEGLAELQRDLFELMLSSDPGSSQDAKQLAALATREVAFWTD